jgi:hypothetical protein
VAAELFLAAICRRVQRLSGIRNAPVDVFDGWASERDVVTDELNAEHASWIGKTRGYVAKFAALVFPTDRRLFT